MDFATVVLFVLLGVIEIASVFLVNRRLAYEHDFMVDRGTVGEQFGEYLLEPNSDEEGAPTRLQVLSEHVGVAIAKTMRFSTMQEKSVDARITNKYEKGMLEGLKRELPLHWRVLIRAAESAGYNIEEIIGKGELQEFIQAFKNSGGQAMLNNNGQDKSGWG